MDLITYVWIKILNLGNSLVKKDITDDTEVKLKLVHFLIAIMTLKDEQGYNCPLLNKTNKLNLVCKIKLSLHVELSDQEYFLPDAVKS